MVPVVTINAPQAPPSHAHQGTVAAWATVGIGSAILCVVWAFIYNKRYTVGLLEKGYQFNDIPERVAERDLDGADAIGVDQHWIDEAELADAPGDLRHLLGRLDGEVRGSAHRAHDGDARPAGLLDDLETDPAGDLEHGPREGELPREEAAPDVVEAILDESAKFTGGVLAPLNKSGDEEGATWTDKAVTRP